MRLEAVLCVKMRYQKKVMDYGGMKGSMFCVR